VSPGLYPLFLKLSGKRCVVVGGGRVAVRKVESLLAAGAEVTVVSPQFAADLLRLDNLRLIQREFTSADFEGAFVVIAATDSREANERAATEARRNGALVNVVDDPERSDFFVPACVERGDLVVAVSTGGASPALARRIREKLENLFPESYRTWVALLREVRPLVLDGVPAERRREVFEKLADESILALIERRGAAEARAAILDIVRESRT